MSGLYNMLFGVNPFAGILLGFLGLHPSDVPRFRDCFLNEDGTRIIIHTRTGGGNRQDYVEGIAALRNVKGFKFDEDSEFDSTYANFHYDIPADKKELVELMLKAGAHRDPMKQWETLLANLKRERPDDPA